MSDLSPAAREMVDTACEVIRPSEADRRRIRAALVRSAMEGIESKHDGTAPPQAASRHRGAAVAVVATVVGLAAAVAIVWWGSSRVAVESPEPLPEEAAAVYEAEGQREQGPASRRTPPPREPAPPASEAPAPPAEDVEVERPRTPRPRAKKQAPIPADLPAELDLLRRARAGMNAGRYDEVLRVVRAYRKSYPGGAFTQEASALRVLALCNAGKRGAGKAARRFLARYPKSLNAPRIRKYCSP